MLIALLVATALAGPSAVVAMGDGLVAGSPNVAGAGATVPGGWVAVLADCLEERAPGEWTVVDRTVAGDTAAIARNRVEHVRALEPRLVVLGVGARELADPDAEPGDMRRELELLVSELRRDPAPDLLLVGMVPPTLSQLPGDPREQEEVDARTARWNRVLAEVAGARDHVSHLDLWTTWPRDPAGREALTTEGLHLSDQGHARVAAAVCDVVIAR